MSWKLPAVTASVCFYAAAIGIAVPSDMPNEDGAVLFFMLAGAYSAVRAGYKLGKQSQNQLTDVAPNLHPR
jgi:urease accessory protein UreF